MDGDPEPFGRIVYIHELLAEANKFDSPPGVDGQCYRVFGRVKSFDASMEQLVLQGLSPLPTTAVAQQEQQQQEQQQQQQQQQQFLTIGTRLLPPNPFRVGALWEFIGAVEHQLSSKEEGGGGDGGGSEVAVGGGGGVAIGGKTDSASGSSSRNNLILHARTAHCVDGRDLALYDKALQVRRQFRDQFGNRHHQSHESGGVMDERGD